MNKLSKVKEWLDKSDWYEPVIQWKSVTLNGVENVQWKFMCEWKVNKKPMVKCKLVARKWKGLVYRCDFAHCYGVILIQERDTGCICLIGYECTTMIVFGDEIMRWMKFSTWFWLNQGCGVTQNRSEQRCRVGWWQHVFMCKNRETWWRLRKSWMGWWRADRCEKQKEKWG